MAYLVELDVDSFGSLDAPADLFPVNVGDHDWLGGGYPSVSATVPFEWTPGEVGTAPDIFWYPQMRDWVCNQKAFGTLAAVSSDLHVIAAGSCRGRPLRLVQALPVLDVVDRENSLIDKYPSYEILRFPTFFESSLPQVENRIFRVPGGIAMIFVGETVRRAIEADGIRGLSFTPVDISR